MLLPYPALGHFCDTRNMTRLCARYESKPWVLKDLQTDPNEMKYLIGNAALVKKKDQTIYTADECLKWEMIN